MTQLCSFLSAEKTKLHPFSTRCRERFIVRGAAEADQGTLTAKTLLRELSTRTERGLTSTPAIRSEIEEAQVLLEGLSANEVDFQKLEGRWRLIYTNARDVLPVLFLGRPPLLTEARLPWPVKVGAIYQEFSSPDEGNVKNIIKLGIDNVFEEEGITLAVHAKYQVCGPKRIALAFQKAEVSDLQITSLAESLLAPAFLPRTGFNHQLLLAVREFSASVPLRQESTTVSSVRETAGYLLTFLDDDMLIGRPLDQGGTFIFNREQL